MHERECAPREGVTCEAQGDCYGDQFCRDFGDAGSRCTRVGSCSVDADCNAITSVSVCADAGIASWVCRAERCATACP